MASLRPMMEIHWRFWDWITSESTGIYTRLSKLLHKYQQCQPLQLCEHPVYEIISQKIFFFTNDPFPYHLVMTMTTTYQKTNTKTTTNTECFIHHWLNVCYAEITNSLQMLMTTGCLRPIAGSGEEPLPSSLETAFSITVSDPVARYARPPHLWMWPNAQSLGRLLALSSIQGEGRRHQSRSLQPILSSLLLCQPRKYARACWMDWGYLAD